MSSSRHSNNKKKKGRRRPRSEIGKEGDIFSRCDARSSYIHAVASGANLPSFEELTQHWKVDPTDPERKRLLCNLDGGKWKIIIPLESIHPTALQEIKTHKFRTFREFKLFMMDKYYISEEALDDLRAGNHEHETEAENNRRWTKFVRSLEDTK